MVGGLRRISSEPSLASGSLQNLFLAVWRESTHRAAVDLLYGGVRSLVREWPAGVGLMLFVEPGTVLPTADVRDYMLEQRRRVAPHLIAASLTVPGDTLWSSTVRTIAVTLGLSSGSVYPAKSFADLDAAARWQVGHMGADFSVPAESLVRALHSLRANVATHPQGAL